jgi:hypothetical protein
MRVALGHIHLGIGQAAAEQAYNASVESAAGCAAQGGSWDGQMCEFWPSASAPGTPFKSNTASCQYQLPNVALLPGIPVCGPSGYTVGQVACGGMTPNAPGYAACLAAQEQDVADTEPGESTGYDASIQQMIAQIPAPTTPAAPSKPLTSSLPIAPSPGGGSGITTSDISNPPTVVPTTNAGPVPPGFGTTGTAVSSSTTTSTSCFQLFGVSEPCWGPVGQYTALVGIAALVGLYFMMKK